MRPRTDSPHSPRRSVRRSTACTLLFALAACAPVAKTSANTGTGLPAELVFCRANIDAANTAEIALRTTQNLGTDRVPERSGRELQVRVHPDGTRVVFARESTPGTPGSAEIHVAGTNSAEPELRLTVNNVADDHPCWSPTGDRVLFVSTRDGDRRLYVAGADGSNQQPLLSAAAGIADDDPDWSRATDRIVFSRRDASGLRRLFLMNGDGTGLVPLTAGGPTASPDLGQREPTFSPDGQQVAFVQVLAPGVSRLFTADVATGTERLLFDPLGEVRVPRFSPTADRIFCGLAQPLVGRQGLRLSVLTASGQDPLLVEPGEQWQLLGVDVLPTMAAGRAAQAPEVVSLGNLELQVSSGTPVSGSKSQLDAADGQSLALATDTFGDHEIASINCVFTLPVAAAGDVLAVRVTIVASVSRSDAATTLRTSLHNPVLRRFDTIAELPAPGTGMRTLEFATQSLAHVSLERQVRVTVIGEIGAGARALLNVDLVRLTFVRAASAAAPR